VSAGSAVTIFRFADHVRLGPLTALIVRRAVGCALGRMSAIVHEWITTAALVREWQP